MTRLLEKAFEEARKLSEEDQDALAWQMLEEIADDRRWNEVFARSQDALEKLADEARADIKAGRTVELDPAQL